MERYYCLVKVSYPEGKFLHILAVKPNVEELNEALKTATCRDDEGLMVVPVVNR